MAVSPQVLNRDWRGILAVVVTVGDLMLHVFQANFPNVNTSVFDFAVPTIIAFYFASKSQSSG